MAKPWQQKQPGNALAFGASDGADADDYYDFLPSDDDNDLSGDEHGRSGDEHGRSGVAAVASSAVLAGVGQQDIVTLASVPLSGSAVRGDADIAATTTSSAVLTPIGHLGGGASGASSNRAVQRPASETLALVATGAVILSGGKQLRVSPESLAKHANRKSQLESALDAFSGAIGSNSASSLASGEAPFRFRASVASTSSADVEMADVSASQPATHSKQQQHSEQMSSNALKKMAAMGNGDKEEKIDGGEKDLLYDDSMDDADEKWVQRNFRVQGGVETDATLCCPCCFMTVCMDCQRHVKFTNQYRSSAAVNCRIKRDEILTYTSGAASASALPFQKRLNLAATRSSNASSGGEGVSLLLTANEFYPVACSDCGTTVGVYDREQQYHFFNVLPSNC